MKQHNYRKLAGALALMLGVQFALPANSTEATGQWEQLGDFNLDEVYDVQDEKVLLDRILQRDDFEFGYYDYNEDGEVSIEDLYMLYSDLYSEDQPRQGNTPLHESITPVFLSQAASGDAVQVEVNLKDPLAETGYFDYAILYDRERLKVEDIQWSGSFTAQFPEEQNAYAKADMEDYVLLAGTYVHRQEDVSADAVTAEALATITFSYQNGQKEAGTIDVTSHATRYDKSVQNLRVHADNASESGDVDNNGIVNLQDVTQVLHRVLFKEKANMHEFYMADFNNNGKLELSDAERILRVAIKADNPSVSDMNWNPMRAPLYAEWITETVTDKRNDLRLLNHNAYEDELLNHYADSFSNLQVRDMLQEFRNVCRWKATVLIDASLENTPTSHPMTIKIGGGSYSVAVEELVAQVAVHTDKVEDISYRFESVGKDVYMHVQEPAYSQGAKTYYLHVICYANIFSDSVIPNLNELTFHVDTSQK